MNGWSKVRVRVRYESDRCRTNRLRQQVISERCRRWLSGAGLMRVDVNACLQFPKIFLALEGKPLSEAQVTATICLMEIKRLGVI